MGVHVDGAVGLDVPLDRTGVAGVGFNAVVATDAKNVLNLGLELRCRSLLGYRQQQRNRIGRQLHRVGVQIIRKLDIDALRLVHKARLEENRYTAGRGGWNLFRERPRVGVRSMQKWKTLSHLQIQTRTWKRGCASTRNEFDKRRRRGRILTWIYGVCTRTSSP